MPRASLPARSDFPRLSSSFRAWNLHVDCMTRLKHRLFGTDVFERRVEILSRAWITAAFVYTRSSRPITLSRNLAAGNARSDFDDRPRVLPFDLRSMLAQQTPEVCAEDARAGGRVCRSDLQQHMHVPLTRRSRVCNHRIPRRIWITSRYTGTSRVAADSMRACVSIRQMFPHSGIYFMADN